jgi:DNA-binding transcriptional regulator LsrR (DeoR family)
MVLDSPVTAAALREVNYVATTLTRFPDITCALIGIGVWKRPGTANTDLHGSTLRAALPAPLVRKLDAAGAVADICSTVLNAEGAVVGGDAVSTRCIAITTDQLHKVPDVIGLAGGADKAAAIVAAVRAGLLHTLITDTSAATAVLAT